MQERTPKLYVVPAESPRAAGVPDQEVAVVDRNVDPPFKVYSYLVGELFPDQAMMRVSFAPTEKGTERAVNVGAETVEAVTVNVPVVRVVIEG